MSTRSKATFAASCVFTASTIAAVYYWQDMSFQTRRVGLVRDDERRAQWRENVRELERQEALRKKLEVGQSVTQTS